MKVFKLLITGGSGLVGSRFKDIFKNKFFISTIGRNDVDIKINLTSENDVFNTTFSSDADAVVNFAAFTNVDGAENEKGDRLGEIYKINAMLPLWLARACSKSGKSLYHISTDYVFDGKKDNSPYTEEDLAKPVDSWYALSKFDGETNVRDGFGGEALFTIVRISYPYSAKYERKLDFARVIIDKLSKGENYFGSTDQKIKPTSVDDIAQALALLISKKARGIYHVAGKYPDGYISPYAFAQKIAGVMNLNANLIQPITFLDLSKKRVAPRPQNTWIDTAKIEKLGMEFTGIDDILDRFKKSFNQSLRI